MAGLSFMDTSHEPLAFLSGVFRGSQLCWSTMDKKSFAILSAFQCVPYLLRDGSDIFCDHHNSAYIFSPQSCGVTSSKAASQGLAGWCACMYVCMYGHRIQQSMYQPGKVANPARGQLNRENEYSPVPYAPENLVSRDGFSRPLRRQPAHSPYSD